MSKRRKQPRHTAVVHAKKEPRSHPLRTRQIRISFIWFDSVTQWCEPDEDGARFFEVAKKLRDYERMTWQEISSRDHSVAQSKLIQAAQDKLKEQRLDDFDELWRFGFDGLTRLWGLRIDDWFYALWWDPLHKICPSRLRHT